MGLMIDRPKQHAGQLQSAADLDDDVLLARLFEIQMDLRELLLRYQIKPTTFVGMARQARKAISSTETRADLLELLIELQEFGAAAKDRGVIGEAAMTDAGKHTSGASAATAKRRGTPESPGQASTPAEPEPVPSRQDRADINQSLSDEFFKGLGDRDTE